MQTTWSFTPDLVMINIHLFVPPVQKTKLILWNTIIQKHGTQSIFFNVCGSRVSNSLLLGPKAWQQFFAIWN
jgi:hypothetical protein